MFACPYTDIPVSVISVRLRLPRVVRVADFLDLDGEAHLAEVGTADVLEHEHRVGEVLDDPVAGGVGVLLVRPEVSRVVTPASFNERVNPNTSERRFAGWSYIISSSETESSTSRSASNSAMSRVRSFRIDASEFAISIGSMATTASRSASACSRNDHPFSSAGRREDRLAGLFEGDVHSLPVGFERLVKELERERRLPGPGTADDRQQRATRDPAEDHLVEPLDSDVGAFDRRLELVGIDVEPRRRTATPSAVELTESDIVRPTGVACGVPRYPPKGSADPLSVDLPCPLTRRPLIRCPLTRRQRDRRPRTTRRRIPSRTGRIGGTVIR